MPADPPPPPGAVHGRSRGRKAAGTGPQGAGRRARTDLGPPHAAATTARQDCGTRASEARLLSGSGCLGSDGGQQGSPSSCLLPARSVSSHLREPPLLPPKSLGQNTGPQPSDASFETPKPFEQKVFFSSQHILVAANLT